MKLFLLILAITSLLSCSNHSVITKKELSRLQTTIEFSSSKKPYYAKEQVGGEQINTTTIKANDGEAYLIEVTPENDSLNFNIDGSFLVIEVFNNNPFKKIVKSTVKSDINILLTSHPESGFYVLKIEKL